MVYSLSIHHCESIRITSKPLHDNHGLEGKVGSREKPKIMPFSLYSSTPKLSAIPVNFTQLQVGTCHVRSWLEYWSDKWSFSVLKYCSMRFTRIGWTQPWISMKSIWTTCSSWETPRYPCSSLHEFFHKRYSPVTTAVWRREHKWTSRASRCNISHRQSDICFKI